MIDEISTWLPGGSILLIVIAFVLAAGLAVLMATFFVARRSSKQAPALGVNADGRLEACPAFPNCVSSQADPDDALHHVMPLSYRGSAEEAMRLVERAAEEVLGDRLSWRERFAEGRPGYARFEARTRLFGFVDDVELVVDRERRRIDVRSASRVGQGDLGANRERVLLLTQRYEALSSEAASHAAATRRDHVSGPSGA